MDRKHFLQLAGLSSISMAMKPISNLEKMMSAFKNTPKMPVLFLGHGTPMNAIEENEYTLGFKKVAKNLPKPNAIICVSAHWLTRGTKITAMENPRTIHDFGGFPQELHDVNYPAKGNNELAKETQKLFLPDNKIELDHEWGLDHGTWSVLKHLYPNADIPVLQLSIDYYKSAEYHFELAKKLAKLRRKGVLIIGSGNIVHNLKRLDKNTSKYDWGNEAREKLNKLILDGNFKPLLDYKKLGKEVQLAIPTPDHYFPLIYTLGLKEKKDTIKLFNDSLQNPRISMTSLKID